MTDSMQEINESNHPDTEKVSEHAPSTHGANERPLIPEADLEWREYHKGSRAGGDYVRIVRPEAGKLTRLHPGHLLATEKAFEGRTTRERLWNRVRRAAIGRPLTTADQSHERLTKIKALAVFGSDAVSSTAYATDEILLALVAAGTLAFTLTIPIALAIIALLAIVALSYSQTIRAYPQGGGSYIVTKDNLGTLPSLIAGASLLTDYILTVAVSISSGVANISAAFPELLPYRVELAVAFIVIITLVNLRGVRESGTIFAAPTYLFILGILIVIVAGAFRLLTGQAPVVPVEGAFIPGAEAISIFLILRAFASGCAALTGTEAISDGVPAFKAPEWQNARRTLVSMAVTLGVLFLGIASLAYFFKIVPTEGQTVISLVTQAAVGPGPFFFYIQAVTMLILVLAANTSFSDFPRLAFFLARDRFMPNQFRFRGDRLGFSTGILALALLATLLVVAFEADTHALIPLYAIGVFVSFTLSQSSMVRRWWRTREAGWRKSMAINAIGASVTGVVAVIVATTKFEHGAWMILIIIPAIVLLLVAINRHYRSVAEQLSLENVDAPLPISVAPHLIVPIDGLHRGTINALAYARSLSKDVVAISVTDDMEAAQRLRERWDKRLGDIPLVIIESPYRSLTGPLLTYIDAAQARNPDIPITIVVPEFVPRHWWEYPLHNQSALRLRLALRSRPKTVVIDVPFHLER
jgi:amino acid transporter